MRPSPVSDVAMKPSRSDPVMFTMIVPHGKKLPKFRMMTPEHQ